MSKNKFLIVVQSEFTRDVQIAEVPEAEKHESDNWSDYEGEVVVGIYYADDEGEAICEAAINIAVSGEILKSYELK